IPIEPVELLALVLRRHWSGAQLFQSTARKAISLFRLPCLLVHRLPRSGDVLQRIFLRAVDRHVVVAAHAGVDKLDVDVIADTVQVAVVPDLKREGRGVAAALFHWTVVGAAAWVRVDVVGLAVGDVDMTAIGSPAWLAGGEVFVRVRDAGVVLFAELVLGRVWIGVAAKPELLDKLVALFVITQTLERLHLLVGDDPANVLVDPLLI